VPTLSAGRWVLERARAGALPAVVIPKALLIGPLMTGTFQRAYQAGVKIAFGTDQGVAAHGDNAVFLRHPQGRGGQVEADMCISLSPDVGGN